jgi:outer membrane lipoprotein-sorting protein
MLKALSRLFSVSITLILFFSCVTKRIEIPVYEGIDVRDVLSAKNSISAMDATFSIIFEKGDSEMRGEGVLNISRIGDLSLRVYSFGFLALEVTSENGMIKSNPRIDRNKSKMLTQGLRDCLFWWDIQDFEIDEKDGMYLLRNFSREIWLDKKTILPIKQRVSLEDGKELRISYEDVEKMGDVWYPSTIKIELSQYSVTLKMREILFTSAV